MKACITPSMTSGMPGDAEVNSAIAEAAAAPARVEPHAAGAVPSAQDSANLIAAAPGLLAALKEMVASVSTLDHGAAWDDRCQRAWEAGRDAIAKAEGRS